MKPIDIFVLELKVDIIPGFDKTFIVMKKSNYSRVIYYRIVTNPGALYISQKPRFQDFITRSSLWHVFMKKQFTINIMDTIINNIKFHLIYVPGLKNNMFINIRLGCIKHLESFYSEFGLNTIGLKVLRCKKRLLFVNRGLNKLFDIIDTSYKNTSMKLTDVFDYSFDNRYRDIRLRWKRNELEAALVSTCNTYSTIGILLDVDHLKNRYNYRNKFNDSLKDAK